MQEIGIETSLVEAIRNGEKTIEGRLGKPRFLKIQEDDILSIREDIWHNGTIIGSHDDTIRVKVTQVLYFETFKEMLSAVNFQAAVPDANTLEEAVAKYAEFYTPEDEQTYGVVCIMFELI